MAYKGQPIPSSTYQQARAKVSDGKSVRVTVPENTEIVAGTLVFLGGFLGFAGKDVTTGAGQTEELILNIEQAEYETSQVKEEDDMDTVGVDLFWDEGGKHLTETPTAVYAGKLTVVKSQFSADPLVEVIWFNLAPQLTAAADAALLAAQVGDVEDLDTTAEVVVAAINEVLGELGDVDVLDTTASDVVAAVNEVLAGLGDVSTLDTTASDSVAAINEVLSALGDTGALDTTASDAVAAINEVLAELGDVDTLDTTADDAVAAINEVLGNVGDLSVLNTTEQGSAVGAINEVEARVAAHQADAATAAGDGLPAVLLTGDSASDNAILWVANEVGPGGNDSTVTLSDTGSAGEATVSVAGTDITVVIEAGVTLASAVIDAVNAHAEANVLVTALNGDDSDGSGTVGAVGQTSLAGGTNMVGIPSVSEVNAIKDVVNEVIAKLIAADLMDES